MSVLVGAVGPEVNKFEQVSSYDYAMSLAGGMSAGGGSPYHVTYPMMHGMLPTSPWTIRLTDRRL